MNLPGVKMVLTSGFTNTRELLDSDPFLKKLEAERLQKPYT